MPVIFCDFIIRQPRVSTVNHKLTLPPTSSGVWTLADAFQMKYTGSATTAVLFVTAKNILTLIDNNRTHVDNLNVVLSGQLLSDVITAVSANPNYTITLIGNPNHRALLSGFTSTNILNTFKTVQYGQTAEFLIEAENTAKLGTATVRYLKNNFSYVQTLNKWQYNNAAVPTATGLLVPVNGIRPIENGANMVFTPNPDNASFDLSYLKTETNQVLVSNAQANTQFINFGVTPYLVPNTLVVVINGTTAVVDVDYSLSVSDKRINFIKGVNNESHVLLEDTDQITSFVQGIGGVITDSITAKRNGNPLTRNVDFVPRVSSQYQEKDVGPGTIFFTTTYTDDPIAEYVYGIEESLLSDFEVVKNGTTLDSSEYVVVLEAGFLNLNVRCFPGDVVTCSYRSKKFGLIEDEILAGTAGAITGIATEPMSIVAGVNDTFSVLVDNTFTDTVTLPIGSSVMFADVISAYNSQAANSILTLTGDQLHLIVASKTGGPSSQIKILNGNANATLGFTFNQISNGTGAVGGEFAFNLANAPVQTNSFSVPVGGDTFIIREFNVATNYPPGAIVNLNNDLYIVDSVSTTNEAYLYSTNPSVSTVLTFRISEDINDIFKFEIDGAPYTVVLTSGEVTAQDIVDDINLIAPGVASLEFFNTTDKIKLTSPTTGIGASVKILDGTANDTLGFTNQQVDTGLTDTVVKIVSGYRQGYINPTVYTTRTPVTFLTETNQHEKQPLGVASIFFNGVDVTAAYQAGVVIKINNDLYTIVASQFSDNKTEVKIQTPLVNHLFTTDTISYTNRVVFAEGDTVLSLRKPPIQDLPIVVKDNGSTLVVDTDYQVTQDGRIRLTTPLNPTRNITATYTVFTTFDAGDNITMSYRFFSSVNEGSVVTASYQYQSADQFFSDVVYQDALADKLLDKVKADTERLQNPSSSGFQVGAGGGNANSDGGSETPKLSEYKYRYDDAISKKVWDFFDTRIKGLTDERMYYNGAVVGANDGPVTEANIQDVINNPTRLYPQGYTSTDPRRVNALDGLAFNDDGSSTGGSSTAQMLTTYTSAEYTDITNETTYINQILAIATGTGPVSITGTVTIAGSVLFYDGTGINPANNVFSFTKNGSPFTVTFTASGVGTSTTLTSILSQINAVTSGTAFNSSNRVQLQASAGLSIGSGSANTTLGFTNGQSVTTREGSSAYVSWRALVQDEINQQTTELARLNSIAAALAVQMQEWLAPYDQAFDEAKAQLALVNQFITDTTASQTQNNTDYNMNVQINSNLTTRRDTTNPARQTKITTFVNTITARLTQITNTLVREVLFDKRYSWLKYRAGRTTGTIVSIERAVQNQIKAAADAAANKTMTGSL